MTAPFDRSAAIARVGFIMPGLTDAGLRTVVEAAEVEARHHPRDLTPATLAAEQREREAAMPDVDRRDAPATVADVPCWAPNPDGSPCQAQSAEVRGEEGRCEEHPFD